MNTKRKNNKIKEKAVMTDEQTEIKRFIIILTSLVVIIIGIFVFTKYVINDGDVKIPIVPSAAGNINYSIATVGTMFNKADGEYFVSLYDATQDNAVSYAATMSKYLEKEGALPLYFVDLDNSLNHKYLATEEKVENVNAKTINDLSLGEVTLVKIRNGEIVEYYSGIEAIKNVVL